LEKCGFDARTCSSSTSAAHNGKNRLGLLQIFNSLRELPAYTQARLLMVGKPLSDSLLEYIAKSGLESAVEHLTDVSNEI